MKPIGHFSRYGASYLVCALFIDLQVLLSYQAQVRGITAAQWAAMARFDHRNFWVGVFVSCLPVIIAFLNQSISRARALPATIPDPPAAPAAAAPGSN